MFKYSNTEKSSIISAQTRVVSDLIEQYKRDDGTNRKNIKERLRIENEKLKNLTKYNR